MLCVTQSRNKLIPAATLVALLNAAGCPQSGTAIEESNGDAASSAAAQPGVNPAGAAIARPAAPLLFVADGSNGVLAFANPASADGDVAPSTQIWGTYGYTVWYDNPLALAVDRAGDLVALTQDGLLSFDGGATASGNLDPDREITGPSTYLQYEGFNVNRGMVIDRGNDRLFAANIDSIMVFDDFAAGALSGDVNPTRRIQSVDIDQINSIVLAPNGDLYVADVGKNAVLVYANAGARDGNIRADRLIQIPNTRSVISGTMIQPEVVYVDQQDHLYVIESLAGFIHVLDQAAARSGIVTPERVIDFDFDPFPNEKDFWPVALVVDSQGVGYVSDYAHSAIRIIPNIASRNGTLAPERTIQGFATHIENPDALFIWE